MFYVSSHYFCGNGKKGCRVVDFDTKEEQIVTLSELYQRVDSGETIIGVRRNENGYFVQTKGGKGEITLEDFAILKGRKYLLDEFDYEKNQTTPSKVYYGSTKEVFWRCSNGHSYTTSTGKRTCRGGSCPYCNSRKVLRGFNDLEKWCNENSRQDLLKEWDYNNNEFLPSELTPYSNKTVHWICPEKKHSYSCILVNRTRLNVGCPYCHSRTSFPEQAVFYYLKQGSYNIDNRFKYGNKYEIDIYLLDYNLGIEYDGKVWHSSDDSIRRDEEKNKVLSDAGIKLIRLRERGCSIIEKHGSEEIIVDDLEVAIRELFTLLTSKLGIFIYSDINIKRDRQVILAEYRSSKQEQSIRVTHPNIASEWNHIKNGDLKPEMFTCGSGEKVWWQCGYCGHEWVARIIKRCRSKSGCPICRRERSGLQKRKFFAEEYPEIKEFWADTRGMDEISIGSDTSVNISCPKCRFEEDYKELGQRIKRQNGLTCKQCGYHVAVQKWNKENEEYLKRQQSVAACSQVKPQRQVKPF